MNQSDLSTSEKNKPEEAQDSSKRFVGLARYVEKQNEELLQSEKSDSLKENKKRNFNNEMNFLMRKKTQSVVSSDEHRDIALQIAELIKTTELDIIREKEKEIEQQNEKEIEVEIKTGKEKQKEKEKEKELKTEENIQVQIMEDNSQVIRNIEFETKTDLNINNEVSIEEKRNEVKEPSHSPDSNTVLLKENITNMNNINNITMSNSIEMHSLINSTSMKEEKKKERNLNETNQGMHEKEKENSLKEQINSTVENIQPEKEKQSIDTDDIYKIKEKSYIQEKETNEVRQIIEKKENCNINDEMKQREKKGSLHIQIPYSSGSERSDNESEQESSVESVEDSYGKIYNQGILLDTHRNSVKEKTTEEDKTSPQILFNSLADTKEEIKVLNEFIHEVINVNQENNISSSSIEVDSKLMNILSFSFLTFVDHVINDSHVYAINKEEEAQKNQIQQAKTKTNITEHISKSPSVIDSSIKNPSENSKPETSHETLNTSKENAIGEAKSSNTMIFDANVINTCLHNMYNEQMVQQKKKQMEMKKEKKEKTEQENATSHFGDNIKDGNTHNNEEGVKGDHSNKVENNKNIEMKKFHIKKNVMIERNKQIQKINDKINDNKMKCTNEAITSNEVKKSKYSIYDIFDI